MLRSPLSIRMFDHTWAIDAECIVAGISTLFQTMYFYTFPATKTYQYYQTFYDVGPHLASLDLLDGTCT